MQMYPLQLGKIIVGAILLVLVLPLLAEARTVIRSADTISIGTDQLIEGDFYTIGKVVNVSGEIEEDLLAAGTEITINGQIGQDVLILGGEVDVSGTIGDDLRIIGDDVVLSEPILGDVFIVGRSIEIEASASITGDLTVIGSSAVINAPVEGRVLGWIDSVRIDAPVTGNVEITTNDLTLGDKANITGAVEYVSANQLVRSQSATVVGDVVRTDPMVQSPAFNATAFALQFLTILFSAALWYLLSRRTLQRVANRALLPGIRSIVLGTLVLVFAPIAIMVLLLSMLGLLAGLALMTAYLLLLILAAAALPAVIGHFAFGLTVTNPTPVSLLTLLLGSILLSICLLIPFVGPVLIIGFFVLTFGALVDLLLRAAR